MGLTPRWDAVLAAEVDCALRYAERPDGSGFAPIVPYKLGISHKGGSIRQAEVLVKRNPLCGAMLVLTITVDKFETGEYRPQITTEDQMTPEEARDWKPVVRRRALASRVLVVARTRVEGAWAAYCDAVPGYDHDDEQGAVLLHGDKLNETFARVLFPEFASLPYAH